MTDQERNDYILKAVYEGKTLREIADELGLTKNWVSQLRKKAIKQIEEQLKESENANIQSKTSNSD